MHPILPSSYSSTNNNARQRLHLLQGYELAGKHCQSLLSLGGTSIMDHHALMMMVYKGNSYDSRVDNTTGQTGYHYSK